MGIERASEELLAEAGRRAIRSGAHVARVPPRAAASNAIGHDAAVALGPEARDPALGRAVEAIAPAGTPTTENGAWRTMIYKAGETAFNSPPAMQVATRKAMAQAAPDALSRLEHPATLTRTNQLDRAAARTYEPPVRSPFQDLASGALTGHVRRAAAEQGMTPRRYVTPGVRTTVRAALTGAELAPHLTRALREQTPGTGAAQAREIARGAIAQMPALGDLMRERPVRDPEALLRTPLAPQSVDEVRRKFVIERKYGGNPAPAPLVAGASAADQIARRDAHADALQRTFDEHHAPLADSIARRDAYQVELGRQGVVGVLRGVAESRNALATREFGRAAYEVGEHVGRAVDPALAVASLNHQARIEKHLNPYLDAREALLPMRTEQAYERDRMMVVDDGDRFYDAHETTGGETAARARADRKASEQVPPINPAHANLLPSTLTDGAQRVVTGLRNRHVLPDAAADATGVE